MLNETSDQEVLPVNDMATGPTGSCDGDPNPDLPIMANASVPVVDRSGIEHQPITLLVGDFRVRLLPKYRRGRRLFYCADPESASDAAGQPRDLSAGTMLLSPLNFPVVVGENIDLDNGHATSGVDDRNYDTRVDNRSSSSRFMLQQAMHSDRYVAITTTNEKANCNKRTSKGERMANRKQTVATNSRQTSGGTVWNRKTVLETGCGGTALPNDNMEVSQRSSTGTPLVDGDVRETTARAMYFESDDQTFQSSFAVDGLPGYPVCNSETELEEDDTCRRKPLLLNDVTSSSEAEAAHDNRRCRKQVTQVGRRRRMTLAISRRLKLDSATVRRRCDPYKVSRQVLGFLASTVGLTCLLVGYTALGGLLFVRLEGQNAGRVQSGMRATRTQFTEKLWAMTERLNVLHHDNWTLQAEQILDDYATQVYLATKRSGWDGTNKDDDEAKTDDGDERSEQWSYAGALLFSITVITTIGYGHITPKTTYGRLATIIYAVIGIPLTLLTITQLGGIMATLFRFIYKNLDALCWQTVCRRIGACCRNGCRLSSSQRKRILLKKRKDVPQDMMASAIVDDNINNGLPTGNGLDLEKYNSHNSTSADENLNERSGVTRMTSNDVGVNLEIDTSTLNDGDVMRSSVEQDQSQKDCDNDLTVEAGCDRKNDDVMCRPTTECRGNSDSEIDDEIDDVTISAEMQQLQRARWATRLRSRILIAFADVDEVRVPAWVCLLLVVGYIVLGALVFSVWERTGDQEGESTGDDDWDFLVGCYFCFITLSTIGFGDYVPGTRHVTWDDAQEKLVLCALYLLVGLALQAMCFQLIQEDARRAVRALGIRLGLITEDNGNGD